MNYQEKLESMIDEKDGLILTKDLEKANIPRSYLYRAVKAGQLKSLRRGVYLSDDAWDDAYFWKQAIYQRMIYSHETALYFLDLTDRDPLVITVTVPFGYNASRLRKEGIQVYSVKKEWYEIGIVTVQTNFGRDIRCYNEERTICDLLSPRYQADLALVTEAVKRYFRKKDKNVPFLLNYAKTFGVEKRIKAYMEVLM
ncbi:type IV toxin-antitoxin system AbiEi family antitoxin domain-containing protein [Acetobacterium sp.]|uniref:type IV toxin-antitoxin system AbiEi family antitoxin domain-containing protein n=1 Tax=Acetobacterium sp. TaxID=1872094 RepID=UPI002F3F9890